LRTLIKVAILLTLVHFKGNKVQAPLSVSKHQTLKLNYKQSIDGTQTVILGDTTLISTIEIIEFQKACPRILEYKCRWADRWYLWQWCVILIRQPA